MKRFMSLEDLYEKCLVREQKVTRRILGKLLPSMDQDKGGRGLGSLSVEMSVEWWKRWINVRFGDKSPGFADRLNVDYDGGREIKDFS